MLPTAYARVRFKCSNCGKRANRDHWDYTNLRLSRWNLGPGAVILNRFFSQDAIASADIAYLRTCAGPVSGARWAKPFLIQNTPFLDSKQLTTFDPLYIFEQHFQEVIMINCWRRRVDHRIMNNANALRVFLKQTQSNRSPFRTYGWRGNGEKLLISCCWVS